jgi:hypothetical protein
VGIEWVLQCCPEKPPASESFFFFPGTVLYRTWFGAPCLEVDATFVQVFLDNFGAGLEAHGALDQVGCDMPAAL